MILMFSLGIGENHGIIVGTDTAMPFPVLPAQPLTVVDEAGSLRRRRRRGRQAGLNGGAEQRENGQVK